MKNRSFVWTLAKFLCVVVLIVGFTMSTVGCSEQTSDSKCCAGKCTNKCPAACKKPCSAKKPSTEAAKPAVEEK